MGLVQRPRPQAWMGMGRQWQGALRALGLFFRLRLDQNQPGVVDARPGQRIRLTCRAEGYPPPAIEWQRDGQTLSSPRFVRLLSLPVQAMGAGAARRHLWSVRGSWEMELPCRGLLSLSRVWSGDRGNRPAHR